MGRGGGAENAGLENAGVAKMQGWKTRDWKTRHQTAGVENAGVAQYGKPKSPLFNIVATATRTNVNQKDFMQLKYFYCIIKAELYLPI